MVVVPELGRVMEFRSHQGPNMLWVNPKVEQLEPQKGEWTNYGGDKLWVSPQALWNWPPDPLLDGTKHEYRVIPNGVHLRSRVGGAIPVVLERWITLVAGKAEARFESRMTLAGGSPFKIGIWQVLQMNDPDWIRLGSGVRKLLGDDRLLSQGKTGALVRRDSILSGKFGANDPKGAILAKKGNWYMELSMTVEPGAEYPDGGSSQEVFVSSDPLKYAELELLSPLRTLRAGESIRFVTSLKLSSRG